jgi:hypothetical protein
MEWLGVLTSYTLNLNGQLSLMSFSAKIAALFYTNMTMTATTGFKVQQLIVASFIYTREALDINTFHLKQSDFCVLAHAACIACQQPAVSHLVQQTRSNTKKYSWTCAIS